MYSAVQVSKRSLDEHRLHVGDDVVELIRSLASPLRGARILNLSVSPFGTGVAELLHSLLPLLRDLGIAADWRILGSDTEFAHTARIMYEGLAGRQVDWTPAAVDNWHKYNEFNATLFDGSYDVVIVHDPQAAELPAIIRQRAPAAGRTRWVWHCHLDLRNAESMSREILLAALDHYDLCVFQDSSFAPPGLMGVPTTVVAPAIDPTSARNVELPRATTCELLGRHGVDSDRPLMVQVGPMDPSFEATGAIDLYRQAKVKCRDLQLLLVHPVIETSLEAWSRFERVVRHAGVDPDAHILISQGDSGQLVVNAAQRAASVVVQRSVPAGFALPVWEAQWKGRPVVVGKAGGLPLQVQEGVTGHVAGGEEALVEAILDLIVDPGRAARLGKAGNRVVLQRHLISRFLADEVRLLGDLLAGAQSNAGRQEELVHA